MDKTTIKFGREGKFCRKTAIIIAYHDDRCLADYKDPDIISGGHAQRIRACTDSS